MSDFMLDIDQIRAMLPHRYPFLLVDRVTECVPGEHLTAIKNVTINEPFFQGHFPEKPVMPGVLIIEALAQASGILAFITEGDQRDENVLFFFVGIDGARFKRPVLPGDRVELKTRLLRRRRDVWKFASEAVVDGRRAALAELMVAPGR
ncbi:MAG: 3-hydroxyacyl-ACP dehydratase FabZ [Chromatiales bacterium]|jgi:3-hydroxyacyl-[acyl-carrier-protein] dehydratase|nr:3-hydroxyacyl-ACP dehydratase FabZ [Chromatiales bacterium]MDH3946965.1 3-hydroxyacyl-ACP dehydratase FabZ [Chromatiales bacterium]MDH4014639.1 3-hydroxyacyl-ACP dehydratase FabZ [Chromatiales bacterium]